MTGRPPRILTLALTALTALGLAGCPSISTMGTARTIPEGTYQYYAGLGYGALQDFSVDDQARPESVGVPNLELGARYGVSDRVEVGGKLFPVGAEVGAKVQVMRSASLERGFDLAIAPAVSIYPWSKGVFGWAHLAIPVGFNVGGGNQLVLAPRISELMMTSKEGNGNVTWGGGSMGLAFRVGRGGLRIMPEVSAIIPLSKKLPTDVEAKFALKGPVFQGGIGFLFGP
jgi:hypothetical protein